MGPVKSTLSFFLSFALITSCAGISPAAQFREIGRAPVSPTVARKQIAGLLAGVTPDSLQQTVKTLSNLALWYRDVLDDELITAWKKDSRANLTELLQQMPDARVAVGIIEFSWRQARPATFIPAYVPMLENLMTRYGDSTKPFFDDLLASSGPDGRPLDLSPSETEVVCRILLDLPDLRTWRRDALQILPRYRQETAKLLDADLHTTDQSVRMRASRWTADLAPPDRSQTARTPGATSSTGLRQRPSTGTVPKLLRQADMGFTDIAQKLRVVGYSYLDLIVQEDGSARDVKVARPLGYGLDEKAVEAASASRFSAGTKDGKTIPMLFHLAFGVSEA